MAAEPNGFLALRVFDRVEELGNDDGMIGSADWIYGRLRLWVNCNHDGVNEESELRGLADACVEAIALDYRISRGWIDGAMRFARAGTDPGHRATGRTMGRCCLPHWRSRSHEVAVSVGM